MRRIKIVLAKAGLDGHERGAHAVTAMLRDAGMEVVYLGMFQPADRIVQVALDEDADVIGLSALNGEHVMFSARVAEAMRTAGLDNVLLVVGGVFPVEDIPRMREVGVDGVFPAGTLMIDIRRFILEQVRSDRVPT